MDFASEFSQLMVIIVVLLVAYLGINLWVKRGGTLKMPSFGRETTKSSDLMAGLPMDDETDMQAPGAKRSKGGSNGVDRHGDRFQLTGKDAEAAARVLKRMLKQGKGSKGSKESQED